MKRRSAGRNLMRVGYGNTWTKLKKAGAYLTIMVLLPYIITVFIHGPGLVSTSNVDQTYIKVKTENGSLEMPIEEYCVGILAKEIPANYEEEVLKAQAVLVRTNVYRKIQEGGSKVEFSDDFWTQKEMEKEWGAAKYFKYHQKLKDAWDETEGKVLTYEEKLAQTPFCRLTNGSTRDGKEALGEDYPYLTITDCSEDVEAAEQIQTVTLDKLDAEVTQCDTTGYVQSVRVGQETVSGEEFRNTYGLESSCFTLQNYNEKLRITTRGVGHGIGMSQYTANQMAKDGKKCEEILNYFFKDTELKEVTQIVPNF